MNNFAQNLYSLIYGTMHGSLEYYMYIASYVYMYVYTIIIMLAAILYIMYVQKSSIEIDDSGYLFAPYIALKANVYVANYAHLSCSLQKPAKVQKSISY